MTEANFSRYGGPTIFAGRFVGVFRALVPLVAGTSGMCHRAFLPWNIAASILWVGIIVILGALFGATAAAAVDRLGQVRLRAGPPIPLRLPSPGYA